MDRSKFRAEDSVNSKERLRSALKGERTDRPLFCPAVYEHKARLLGKPISEVSIDAKLIEQAVLAEYETYGPDMLTVGIDIYNIEAETLGCNVDFPDAPEAVPTINTRVLTNVDRLESLEPVEPETSGRMPLVLEAAKAVGDKLGDEVFVRGAISAPCSIAAELVGIEKLIMGMVDQPGEIDKLFRFCGDVCFCYGKAFLDRGVEVCVFDSYAATPLVSPTIFKDLIFPHVSKLLGRLKKCGAEYIEYVMGGVTDPIAEYLFDAGSDVVVSDFSSDVDVFLKCAEASGALVRRNVSPVLIEQGDEDQLREKVNDVLKLAAENRKVIIGTGAISYNTPVERMQMITSMCQNFSQHG